VPTGARGVLGKLCTFVHLASQQIMITRQEFPYLQQLVINDAYVGKNLTIPVFEQGKDFKHLILTGKNGSGKTTVLREISKYIQAITGKGQRHSEGLYYGSPVSQELVKVELTFSPSYKDFLTSLVPHVHEYQFWYDIRQKALFAFFNASRITRTEDVSTVTKEQELIAKMPAWADEQHAAFFKQYLVNKKVYQVFDAMEGRNEAVKQQEQFFDKLERLFAEIFGDSKVILEFVRENFEFYINLSDGRRFTFNELSAGFSAFLSILTELLMRTDLLRKQANDYTYDPCGFVLIDEPETHLHLEMQYQILPLLTSLFPNLQFIVATHSPAVASSITGATVFDLSTGEVMGDEAAGSSFSELMQTHFGVENEYSNVADAILNDIKNIVKISDKNLARKKLLQLLEEKGKYMSAGLKLEVEAQLIGLE
jgi:predicted ATPase